MKSPFTKYIQGYIQSSLTRRRKYFTLLLGGKKRKKKAFFFINSPNGIISACKWLLLFETININDCCYFFMEDCQKMCLECWDAATHAAARICIWIKRVRLALNNFEFGFSSTALLSLLFRQSLGISESKISEKHFPEVNWLKILSPNRRAEYINIQRKQALLTTMIDSSEKMLAQ